MISKPPALLVSWPQRLRADQKVKRACCGITWAILGHARPVGTAVTLLSYEGVGSPFGESFGF